jgi:hypothetical protein
MSHTTATRSTFAPSELGLALFFAAGFALATACLAFLLNADPALSTRELANAVLPSAAFAAVWAVMLVVETRRLQKA